jgi:ABC-2 type transport system permease protein
MQVFLTLLRRELAGFFVSLSGYVIIAVVLSLIGLSFWNLIEALRGESAPAPLTEVFFNTLYFWILLLLTTPVITMRSFALEKFSGTFETLMTAPVSDLQVLLSKYLAGLIFYMVTWLPLIFYIFVLGRYATDASVMDWPTLGTTFLGITMIGSVFVSAGCFASAITRSQIIAAVLSLAVGLVFVLLSFLSRLVSPASELLRDVLSYISMFDHMEDLSRGIIDTRHVAFYLTATVFFLFLTYRVVESRRWK